MTTTNVSGNQLSIVGNLIQATFGTGQDVIPIVTDFTGTNNVYVIDFTFQQQGLIFSGPRTLYINNISNPNQVFVTIDGTQQTFAAPPYSCGYYPVIARQNSKITLSSVGGAATLTNIQIFNYDISPNVWLLTPGGGGNAITAADGAIVTIGTKADAPYAGGGGSASEVAILKGIYAVSAAAIPAGANTIGKVNQGLPATVANSWFASITDGTNTGAVKAASVAPLVADPAQVVSTADGNIVSIGAKADAAITNPATAGSVIAFLKGIASLLAGNLTVIQPAAANLLATISQSAALWNNQGSVASGVAASGNPFLDAGVDGGGVVRTIRTDTTGLQLSGTLAPGTVVIGDSGNLAATAGAATLPGVAGKTTYITGFEVTGSGATAATKVLVTVTGLVGAATKTYVMVVPAANNTSIQPLIVQFPAPLPANAANTAIVVNLPSFGVGNLNAAVSASGFQL